MTNGLNPDVTLCVYKCFINFRAYQGLSQFRQSELVAVAQDFPFCLCFLSVSATDNDRTTEGNINHSFKTPQKMKRFMPLLKVKCLSSR